MEIKNIQKIIHKIIAFILVIVILGAMFDTRFIFAQENNDDSIITETNKAIEVVNEEEGEASQEQLPVETSENEQLPVGSSENEQLPVETSENEQSIAKGDEPAILDELNENKIEDTPVDGLVVSQGEEIDTAVVENDEAEKAKILYEPTEALADITVRAYADEGVFPADVALVVKRIEASGEEAELFKIVEQDLAKSDVEYDNFLALDISFYDADGTEIEPEAGAVNIEIEVNDELLPADVEKESLAIQHHSHVNGEIEVQSVADVHDETEGEIVNLGSVIRADFAVESFSSFTITWQSSGDMFGARSRVNFEYVDSSWNPLPATVANHTFTTSSSTVSIEIADYIDYMMAEGYQFSTATIRGGEGNIVTAVRGIGTGGFLNNTMRLEFRTPDGVWHNLPNNSTIRLVYVEDLTNITINEIEPWKEKRVAKNSNNDGSYDLSLSVSGDVGSIETQTKIDIAYVLDSSGSPAGTQGVTSALATQARNAINDMTSALESNPKIDAQHMLIEMRVQGLGGVFDTAWNDAYLMWGWEDDLPPSVMSSWNSRSADLNYEGGLLMARDYMRMTRPGAVKIVVFIAARPSNRVYNASGMTATDSSIESAKAMLGQVNTDYFFAMRLGNNSGVSPAYLSDLVSGVRPGVQGAVLTSESEPLAKLFGNIEADLLELKVKNILIEDNLSDSVEMVKDEGGTPKAMLVSVLDPTGAIVAQAPSNVTFDGANIEAIYDEDTKKISLDFPDDYTLLKGYTYKVTANIIPTIESYRDYIDNDKVYPNTGDVGTGDTSAGQKGFYSNSSAFLSYTHNDTSRQSRYAMPVVQLDPQELEIEKRIVGLSSAEVAELKATLKFDVNINEGAALTDGREIALSDFAEESIVDGVHIFKHKFSGLPPGTYTVSETGHELTGYDVVVQKNAEAGTLSGGTTAEVRFTNTYTLAKRILSVKKVVTGNLSNKQTEFDFTLALQDSSSNAYTDPIEYTRNTDSTTYSLNSAGGVYAFKLKHNETIHLSLPAEIEYSVSEAAGYYTLTITNPADSMVVDGVLIGELIQDATATFTNHREYIPETGWDHTITPYLIALALAIGATLTIFKKRWHKRE